MYKASPVDKSVAMVKPVKELVAALEEPLCNPKDVTRVDFGRLVRSYRLLASVPPSTYVDLSFVRPKRVAAGERNCVQHAHAVNISVLSRLHDFSDDVKGPVVDDLDAYSRILQVAVLELSGYLGLELMDRVASGVELADQGQADESGAIHNVFAAEVGLAEDHDP